jgi:L-ascorbate metabolism protein UlaG (beta-lactamase superfamily)
MLIAVALILISILAVLVFVRTQRFGALSTGARLHKIQASPNYREGKFQNLSHTPDLKEGVSYFTVMKDFFFGKSPDAVPPQTLPSQKTDLLHLDPAKDILVWFGHASYFLQVDGKKILVDPVLSGHASPVKFTTRSFKGADVYSADDLPSIDYLFLSHDHWDHLDYDTIRKLKPKIKKIVTGLGVGAHLQRWGFSANDIFEKDWNEKQVLEEGFTVFTTPGRHFSGRGFKRNGSLWLSFVLVTPTMKLFLGGDSGYDTHFAAIGKEHGPFDLAVLECGQYNEYWKYIHMMPEEVVQAGADLGAKKIIPIHWAKFSLSLHSWDEPVKRVTAEGSKKNLPVLTPMIGEEVPLKEDKVFGRWWEGL